MLTGLIPFDAGSIEILGYRLPDQDLEIEQRMGLVPDDRCYSTADRRRIPGIRRPHVRARAALAIERARGLMELFQLQADRKIIAEYSKGMRKRVRWQLR